MKSLILISVTAFTLIRLCCGDKGTSRGSLHARSAPRLTANDRFEIQDLMVNLFYLHDQVVVNNLNGDSDAVDDYISDVVAHELHDDFVLTVNGVSESKTELLNRLNSGIKTYTTSHHIMQPFGLLSYDISYFKDVNGIQHMIEDVVVSYSSRVYRGINYEPPSLIMRTGRRQFRREDGAEFKNYGGNVTFNMYTTNINKMELGKNYIVDNGWSEHSVYWVMHNSGIIIFVLVIGIFIGYWCFYGRDGRKVRYKAVDRDSEDDTS